MSKTIVVDIDEQGNSSVDLEGFQGHGCQQVLDAFQEGDLLVAESTKPEYHQLPATQKQKVGR